MNILAGAITQGQAVSLILLFVFLFVFLVADIYLVLSLRRKNKKLAKNSETTDGDDEINQKKNNSESEANE